MTNTSVTIQESQLRFLLSPPLYFLLCPPSTFSMHIQPQKLFLLLLSTLSILQTQPVSAIHQNQNAASTGLSNRTQQSAQTTQTSKSSSAAAPQKKETPAPLPPVIHTQNVRISAPNFAHGDSRHLQLQLDSIVIGLQLRPDDKDSSEFSITQLNATVESSELKGCTARVLLVEKRGRSYTVILAIDFDPSYDAAKSGGVGAISVEVSACTLSKKTKKVSIPAQGTINFIL